MDGDNLMQYNLSKDTEINKPVETQNPPTLIITIEVDPGSSLRQGVRLGPPNLLNIRGP